MTSNAKWPVGRTMDTFYKHVLTNTNRILNGTMCVIDPGSKTPGFAYFYQSIMQTKGNITINTKLKANERLQQIYDKLSLLPAPDILVVEKLRGKMAPAELMWSVGSAMSAVRSPICIECPVVFWRAFAGKQYQQDKKAGLTSDADDAEMMGNALIAYVKEFGNETRIR